jgi:hypothetical protein
MSSRFPNPGEITFKYDFLFVLEHYQEQSYNPIDPNFNPALISD